MQSYTLNLTSGGQCTEFFAQNDTEAERIALERLGLPDAVACDQWDAAGWNDADEPCKRLLIWETEEDSENDAGQKAVAEIQTIGNA
jgi:hypothetical protein